MFDDKRLAKQIFLMIYYYTTTKDRVVQEYLIWENVRAMVLSV